MASCHSEWLEKQCEEQRLRVSNSAVVIQSFYRMISIRSFYRATRKIIANDKKRLFDEINETTKHVNQQLKMDRHEFLKHAKKIIFKNYPGISLENERFSRDFITIKAQKNSIGRSCPLALRQHSKNSVYFVLNTSTNCVSVKCFKCEGSLPLDMNTTVFDNMKSEIIISDKEPKQAKKAHRKLENLDEIQIVKFDHCVLYVDVQSILDFYDLHRFAFVPARLDRKTPVFSSWNTSTFEKNEAINFRYNNIAILTGEVSGIFVVDVDVADNGLLYFQRLCTKFNYRYDHETTCVLTPSGGPLHLLRLLHLMHR